MHQSFLTSFDPEQDLHDTRNIGLNWLVKLRWWAVSGQILTIAIGSFFFQLELPIFAVSAVIIIEIFTNSAIAFRLHDQQKPPSKYLLPLALYGDVILLTGLLYVTGGTMNPFTFIYLVHITLGAILLPSHLAWGLSISTIISYGGMFIPSLLEKSNQASQQPIEQVCSITKLNMNLHLQGMWFAYAVSAILITFFASRIQQSLRDYNRTISQLRQEKLQNDKLSALATLAAGAAHELSTPLATIGLASGEMVYYCENKIYDNGLLEDAQLIREQTNRCKNILFQMSADAGAIQGEKHTPSTTDRLIENALELLGEIEQKLIVHNKLPNKKLHVPSHAVSWSLKGLLSNAADASHPSSEITLECKEDEEYIYFVVTDHGSGMTQEIAEQAPDPFFTTKPVGQGMGLGLFLAKSLATQLEGALSIESNKDKGTTVTLSFSKSLTTQTDSDLEV